MWKFVFICIILSSAISPSRPEESDEESGDDSQPDPRSVEKVLQRALDLHRQSMNQSTKRPMRSRTSQHDEGARAVLDALNRPSTSGINLPPQDTQDDDETGTSIDDIDADPNYCPEVLKLPKMDVSFETMQRIIALRDSGRSHDKIKKLYTWYDRKYYSRFVECVQRGHKRSEISRLLGESVYKTFSDARARGFPIRGYKISEWARREARLLGLTREFHASRSWLDKFKRNFRVSSRKVTKIVSQNQLDKRSGDLAKIEEFRETFTSRSQYFRQKLIFNVDQTGFNLEQSTARTLSHKGERDTILHAQNRNKQTHSYTSQPVITRSGHLAGKIALLFKEDGGKFGPRVSKKIEQLESEYGNIKMYAGTSSIMTNEIQHHWCKDVLVDLISESEKRSAEDDFDRSTRNASQLLRGRDQGMDDDDVGCFAEARDSHNCSRLTWPKSVNCDNVARRHARKLCLNEPKGLILYDHYSNNKPIGQWARAYNIKPMIIPERTTSDLQPLDVIFNRQYKIFVNRITEQAHYDDMIGDVTSREGIMNMHSLIWNQLSSPIYRDMIRWAWHKTDANFDNNEISHVPPMMVRAVQFAFNETHCDIDTCTDHPFTRCSHCGKVFCLRHFLARTCFHNDSSANVAPIDRHDALRLMGDLTDDDDEELFFEDSDLAQREAV